MITNYVNAGYPILAVCTPEPERAELELKASLEKNGKSNLYRWDIEKGITSLTSEYVQQSGPLEVIQWLTAQPEDTIVFAWNFHRFLGAIDIVQALQNARDIWKSGSHVQTMIMLVPDIDIPKELEKSITILDFDLPNREKLKAILKGVIDSTNLEYPGREDEDLLLSAALGLTTFESENAFALSYATQGHLDHKVISEQKAQMVKKNSALIYSKFTETFNQIGGHENLKEFCSKIISSDKARGIILYGVQGTGKSLFAKALGNEAGIPTLLLDIGSLMGSRIGESEQKMRSALEIADAMAPCVLFIDEVGRGFGGIKSSASTDGGTTDRVFGTFLTWMQDHKSRVFTIATTNSLKDFPPEFMRRWDAVFFADLPDKEEREIIMGIHRKKYNIPDGDPDPDMSIWTGAEIESVCRIANMMESTLKDAARFVIPIAKSAENNIREMREWASGRCIPTCAALKASTKPRQRKMITPGFNPKNN